MSKNNPTYQSQIFSGTIIEKDGVRSFKMNADKLYRHFLLTICKVGDEVTMYMTNKRPKRSRSQNNYYWLYLSLIALSNGHTTKELNAWVKGRFLSQGITEIYGDKVRIVKSTKELKVGEFLELLKRIEDVTEVPLPDTTPFALPLSPKEYKELAATERETYSRLTYKELQPKYAMH